MSFKRSFAEMGAIITNDGSKGSKA